MKFHKKLIAALVLMVPVLANAHAGHGDTNGFVSGFVHPMFGLDHLLALLALGFWVALSQRAVRLAAPMLVVIAMLVGASLGVLGFSFAGVEWGIAASVILSGLAVTLRLPVTHLAALLPMIGFALCHGLAHGMEVPAGASTVGFFAGFAVAAFLIMMSGMLVARGAVLLKAKHIHLWLGLIVTLLGGAMLGLG
ncbi:HupE/UreJ family protein [Reinekea blandensis]|uniref:Urease accessory protein UreJ n=1 Tax=Reinekea blandensis MED297 TaxID=314283 RepID=A4BBR4_9GAMM|nr:HupE/UreJ family protein [Reinekea blandensis]EAR10399.1 hypothetical protein MED297_01220 [Reinekea sp. MED297] [Reinekea blandensis MED297]